MFVQEKDMTVELRSAQLAGKQTARFPASFPLTARVVAVTALVAALLFAAFRVINHVVFDDTRDTQIASAANPSGSLSPVRASRDVPAPDQAHGNWVEVLDARGHIKLQQLCQSRCLTGVECDGCNACGETLWNARRPIPWEVFAQGEYVGPFRDVHVPEYRIRVGDELEFVYRLTRVESNQPYELNVGDRIRVESLIDPTLDRDLVIQPDGMITLRMLGQVRAARRTVTELREELEERYKKYYKVPAITVTPLQVNTRLEDLRAAVDSRYGTTGGQAQQSQVTPEGTIQLPAIGSVPAQGLTLDELKQEIDERYTQIVDGIGVTPRLLPPGGSVRLRGGRSAPTGTLLAGGSHHRHAGDRPGRRLEQRWQSAADRRVSPHRRLATDGHETRSSRCTAGRTPLSGRRDLGSRQ